MNYSLEKIVVSTSFGKLATGTADFNDKGLPEIKDALAAITGQASQERKARISISGFKIREGMIIGLKITLRRKKMQQFIEKVINIVLPRIRDFRGISKNSIDQQGSLTFGVREHIVFPEIILEKAKVSFGIEMTLVPKQVMKKAQALEFYTKLGIPFEKEAKEKKGKK